jgi:solute carrier family 35 protein E1
MIQLFVGVLWVLPLWALGICTAPRMKASDWAQIVPVGVFSAGAHGGLILGLGAGAVSFAQILRACEPICLAVNEIIFLGSFQSWQVYASLIPIVGGVVACSLDGELFFSWLAFIACMIANQCAAMKAIFGKRVMKQNFAKSMGAANQYGVVHIVSWLTFLPIAIIVEGPTALDSYHKSIQKGTEEDYIMWNFALSGILFYLNNLVSFMVLAKVSAVTHSIANTVKRSVIIIAACIFFDLEMTSERKIGSAVAIIGVYLYPLAPTSSAPPSPPVSPRAPRSALCAGRSRISRNDAGEGDEGGDIPTFHHLVIRY